MQIAIYGRKFNNQFIPIINTLFEKLSLSGAALIIYEPFLKFMKNYEGINLPESGLFNSHADIRGKCDFLISFGGDGTILESISFIRDSGIPVLGINSGRLGFLADISRDNIVLAIDELFKGKYKLEQRTLLEVNCGDNSFDDFNYALNEFTVQKKGSSMISIRAWLNNDFLNSYWADGLIISTPTGSTAYSLSVGGPLLASNTRGFVISPIAPHNLTVRPIVIPDHIGIRLEVLSRDDRFIASVDHKSSALNIPGNIILKKAGFTINLVKLDHLDFYTTLRNKLMWGADKRN